MADEQIKLLREALPGKPTTKSFTEEILLPWKKWESDGNDWAVYRINGEHWSIAIEKAIIELKQKQSFKPCLLVSKSEYLSTIASPFATHEVPIIADINGSGMLISFRNAPKKKTVINKHKTRISPDLLSECIKLKSLDGTLRGMLNSLLSGYIEIRDRDDNKEQALLNQFFLDFTEINGLSKEASLAQKALLNLEQAGMGGDRDHYFHSFQNFFLGLKALHEIGDLVEVWKDKSRLSWNVSFEFVWFLVSLWHDVGYTFNSRQKSDMAYYGIELPDRLDDVLSDESVCEAKRAISSLTEHLLKESPETAWEMPSSNDRKTSTEKRIEQALDADVRSSDGHSSYSAIRLYIDVNNFIRNCAEQSKRNVLKQSMWLASVSIPFHDWHFRKCIRESTGNCQIPAITMPFSALLTFIDSIQEDRRCFQPIEEVCYLHNIIIDKNRIITADVNGAALKPEEMIWKAVEANDVYSSIATQNDSIEVKYPEWLVDQTQH